MLFKSYCMCLYDAALWSKFNVGTMEKLSACYSKCINTFLATRVYIAYLLCCQILVYQHCRPNW